MSHKRDPLSEISGELARLIRKCDWSTSPAGPIANWTPALLNTVLLMLGAQAEIVLFWGPQYVAFYNDAYAPTIGEKHPRALGRPACENWSELWDDLEPLLRGVRETGETFAAKNRTFYIERRGFGETVYFDVSYSAVRESDGSIGGVLCIVSETTARVLIERALNESEQRFHGIANATPALIWISDATKACTWFNKMWLDFTGRTMDQELGNGWAEGVHPDDYEQCLATYVTAFDKREPFGMDYRLRRNDGEWRIIDDNGVPRFTADGTFLGYIGSCIDVTDERTAHDVINHSEERLRLATENAGIGLFDIDPEGGIDFSYSRRSSTFLMDRERRVPMEHLFSKIHPDDVSRTRAVYEAARDPARRGRFDAEYRVVPEEDRPMRWIKVRGRGVFDDAGKLVRISGTAIDITKEQSFQDALRNSEEQLRLATEHAEIGMWDFDAVNNRSYSHPRVKWMFGIPETEYPPSDAFFALVHPDDIARVLTAYADAMDPEKRCVYDEIYRVRGRDDGILRWIRAKGRGVFDDDGICIRVTGTAMDVTRERETAEALSRSEEQLRLATDYSEIGLWDIDTVKDIVYWTPRVNVMFGYRPDEIVTMKQFRASLHPDDKRKTIGLILDACDPENRTFYDAEYRIVRKNDGMVRWMAAKGRAVFDEAGRCTRMLGVIIDVTDRKAMEEKARESEMRFRTLFESIDDGFCIVEAIRAPDGTIHDFRYIEENPALAKRSGVVGVLGHTIREMLPVEAEGWIEVLAKVQASGEAIRFERFLETTERLLELYVLRVEPAGRDQVAVLFQDVTDRRAAEMRLHEMNETLERRVLERTAALEKSQAALQQAQKMEAIGNLTGGIAHDFNNLLQGLSGNLDLIRRKPDDTARVKRWAESGLQAAERGAKLTAQLLAFSRSQKLELHALDLSELLPGMRELLTRTLGPCVEIALDLEPGKQAVLGDQTQLEMAVLNLAINARDAMPNGGQLAIATRSHTLSNDTELESGDYIELSVSDTGSGMAPDIVGRAFDPFFTTKGVGKGTGLGLSQVYGMIRQAGGTARIQSTPGKGTTVSLFLRKTDQSAVSDARRDDKRTNGKAHTAKILVIDDDPGVRQFLRDSLSAFGYDVSEAENGSNGLVLLDSFKPDLTVIDFAMPGMTGAEVAKKARDLRPDLPVIFASGYADTEAIESQRDERTAVLRKPFRIGELQDAITRLLVR